MANPERIVTMEEMLEKLRAPMVGMYSRGLNSGPPVIEEFYSSERLQLANDLQRLFDGLREMVNEWRRDGASDTAGGRLENPWLLSCADQLDKYVVREKGQ